MKALLEEIKLYSKRLGKIDISSIYIGDGTPTNAIDELGVILKALHNSFNVKGDIAIETIIADISEKNLDKLKSYGINMISIGVQSFDDKYLRYLGRYYNSRNID